MVPSKTFTAAPLTRGMSFLLDCDTSTSRWLGRPISAPEFGDFDCYIYGNEARGLPRDALAEVKATGFTIAGTGAIESLNVATPVNICQYELTRKHRGADAVVLNTGSV